MDYSVLQTTTPYYKVLLQYYSVLQSTTPVLFCTTKYYSVIQSTTPYYKVLLQYYSVLQSTTPVLLCTTKFYSGTTLYYSGTTPCTTKYSFARRGAPTSPNAVPARRATGLILQRHQILHLTLMIDVRHI